MSDRILQLIIKANDQATAQIKAIREELEKLQKLQDGSVVEVEAKGLRAAGQAVESFGQKVDEIKGRLGSFGEAAGTAFEAVRSIGGNEILAGIGLLAAGFNQTVEAIQKLIAASREAYNLLIQSNEIYNKQLIAAQSSVAQSSRIFVNGKELTETVDKIQALRGTIKTTFDLVEKETEDIAGLTTAQVNEIFSAVINNYSKLQAQLDVSKLKQYNAGLDSSEKGLARLAKGFAAFSQLNNIDSNTLNIGIRNILSGTNVNESLLAQRLGLSGQQVQDFQAKGSLVVELLKKLDGAINASALQSKSPGAALTNIKDVFERVARQVGEPLYNALGEIALKAFDALKTIEPQIIGFFRGISQGVIDALSNIFAKLQPLIDPVGKIFSSISDIVAATGKAIADAFGPIAQAGFATLGAAIDVVIQAVEKLLDAIAPVAQAFADFAKSDIGQIVIQAGALAIAFSALAGPIGAALTAIGSFAAGIAAALPTIISLGSAILSLASGPVLFEALAAAVAGLPPLFAAASAAAMPLLAALAPLLALGGAISIAILIKNTKELSDATDRVERLNQITNSLADESLSYASKLKQLSDIQKQQGDLTAEQSAKQKEYQEIVKNSTQAIDAQIAALKSELANLQASGVQNESLNNSLKMQIALLEQRKKLLGQDVPGLKTDIIAAPDKGTINEQIDVALKSARDKLKNTNKDTFQEDFKLALRAYQQAADTGRATATEAIAELEELRTSLKLTPEQSAEVEKQISKIRKDELSRQLDDVKAQQAEIQAEIAKGIVSEIEGTKKASDAKKKELQAQLEDIRSQILAEQTAINQGGGSRNKLIELRNKERELSAQAISEELKGREQIAAARQKESDRAKKDLENQAQQVQQEAQKGVVSQEQAAQKISSIKRQELQKQLDAVRQSLAEAQAANDAIRAKDLAIEQARLQVELAQQEIKGREDVAKAREKETSIVKKELEAQIQAVQAAAEAGNVAQVEAAKKITELKRQELDRQLADLQKAIQEEQKAQVPGKESPRLRELRAEQSKLLADRKSQELAGEKSIQDAILKELERAQSKATSIAKLAETERLQEVQKLVNSGVIRKQDAESLKLQAIRNSLEEELRISIETQKKLEEIPKSNNPLVEENRQKLIRESRQKTADLTLRLLENEKAQQEAALEAFKRKQDDIALSIKNAQEQQKIGFQAQLQLLESSNKLLERRSQLLEAQKNLVKSASDLQQAGYKNAIDLLQSQFETEDKILDRQKQREDLQKRIAEGDTGAAAELAALDRKEARERQILDLKIEAKQAELIALNQQQALEQQSLILEEQKIKLLQKQEEIRLRIALADAKSQAAQAVADAAKTAADPNATGAQKEAAQIAVLAAQQKVGFSQEAIALQKTIAASTDSEFAARREALGNQQQQQRQEKQTELQILQNQQFGLSPLQQGTPEEIANQRAVAAEDARNRASVQAEEARMRGWATPLQQAQASRAANDSLGQFQTGGGIGAAGSAQLQAGALEQARSPLESLASQQILVASESKALLQKQNEYLAKLVELSGNTQGGLNNTFNISGNLDPDKAARLAYKKIEDAIFKAVAKVGK